MNYITEKMKRVFLGKGAREATQSGTEAFLYFVEKEEVDAWTVSTLIQEMKRNNEI